MSADATAPAASASPADLVRVSSAALEPAIARMQSTLADDAAGALSMFVGVTRDSFQGKRVLRLEYEAYEAMAIKQLKDLCAEMRQQWPGIINCAILHRTGIVEVGEASVVIAVTSPHRREALESVSWCIDDLKRRVVIWKKEWYADGSVWKENAEWRETQEQMRKAKAEQ